MPLYVYKCNNCEHQFEVRQRFSDNALTNCPKCEGDIRRVINPVGIVFKGSGFYVTDSRNGKKSALVNGSASSSEEKSDKGEKGEKSAKKSEDSSASAPAGKSDSTSTAKSSEAAA